MDTQKGSSVEWHWTLYIKKVFHIWLYSAYIHIWFCEFFCAFLFFIYFFFKQLRTFSQFKVTGILRYLLNQYIEYAVLIRSGSQVFLALHCETGSLAHLLYWSFVTKHSFMVLSLLLSYIILHKCAYKTVVFFFQNYVCKMQALITNFIVMHWLLL